jgi:phage gpG-like protein
MTPEQFQQRLKLLQTEFKELYDRVAPHIAGKVAVRLFKENFQNEGFFEPNGWEEVKRRDPKESPKNFHTFTRGSRKGKTEGNTWGRRKILTGATGDLGRSVVYKLEGNGSVTILTDPAAFGSKQPYGRVHNEGLKAGRGSGFTMPKRQFIGDHPTLRKAIIDELERKLEEITHHS